MKPTFPSPYAFLLTVRSDTETHHYGNFELEIKITWQLNGGNVIDLHVKVMGTRKNSFKVTEPRDRHRTRSRVRSWNSIEGC